MALVDEEALPLALVLLRSGRSASQQQSYTVVRKLSAS